LEKCYPKTQWQLSKEHHEIVIFLLLAVVA